MNEKIIVYSFKNNIFFVSNYIDILKLRNEFRIQGVLLENFFPFLEKNLILSLTIEEIFIGIEFGFLKLEKILFKSYIFQVFSFLKFNLKNLKKKYVNKNKIKFDFLGNFSIKKWRENYLIIFSKLKFNKKKICNISKKIIPNLNFVSIKSKNYCKIFLKQIISRFKLNNFINYIIFRDLWERGFNLNCGFKFGANYLIYAGNIEFFHACISVFIINSFSFFSAIDIISFGRVGNCTKKRNLIAILSRNLFAFYFSIKWINLLP
jgi:tRNA splicing endonuclease